MTDSITDFLAKHAKTYDPATDTYRRPPFAEPVKAGKNSAIYNAHSYHTKVPPEGIIPYIKHYTDPSDLILDPFCGSGMTGVASIITQRAIILNDLSPAAVHIAKNFTTKVDINAVKIAFEFIKVQTQNELDSLYRTTCDNCSSPATIQYTVWSDVFECGRCGGEIILWEVAVDLEQGKVLEEFRCKQCEKEWKKSQIKRIGSKPVLTVYNCNHCGSKKQSHSVIPQELLLIDEINNQNIPYWYPKDVIDSSREMYIRGSLHKRDIRTADQFYTRRNLYALSCYWFEISKLEDKRSQQMLQFIFTSALVTASRMTRYNMGKRGNGPMSGLLYIPSLTVENNFSVTIGRKFIDIVNGFLSLNYPETSMALCRIGSATKLPKELSEKVDYIFTDPPFGQNLYYSDLNFLWESWLGQFTDATYEAVMHREQTIKAKTLDDYANLMTSAFQEMYRALKPGRWASVVFHNSDDRIWQVIIDAVEKAGFELAETNAFDKTQLSFKGIKGQKGEERVTNKDIVLNLRKPRPEETASINGRTHLAEAEQRALEAVAEFLKTNPEPTERTLQHIWNHVLYGMIRDGSVQVSMAGLEEMLAYHYLTFKMVDGHYYLRGEAVVGGNVFSLQTDTDAITWLSSVLSSQPLTIGELIPLWQRETAHLSGADASRLDRLLEQNFWQDKKTGQWRNPTIEEREKMNAQVDLSAQAHLRVVRRYLDGNLDHRPDDRELAAWIRFCYSREFYEEAAALFERINETILDTEEYKTVRKMAAVAKLKNK